MAGLLFKNIQEFLAATFNYYLQFSNNVDLLIKVQTTKTIANLFSNINGRLYRD